MPIGCVSLIPTIITDLIPRKPKKILDAGIGMGLWGAAVRQWLDMGAPRALRGDTGQVADAHGLRGVGRQKWGTYLMGIEGFSKYRNPCWDLYDYIHEMSIQEYLMTHHNDKFDAILLLDVLEHFRDWEGRDYVHMLQERLTPGGVIYIGTPGVWIEQGAAYGNKFERHQSLWTAEDLRSMGFDIAEITVERIERRDPLGTSNLPPRVTYQFDGAGPDPWGNRMLLAKWHAVPDAGSNVGGGAGERAGDATPNPSDPT